MAANMIVATTGNDRETLDKIVFLIAQSGYARCADGTLNADDLAKAAVSVSKRLIDRGTGFARLSFA